MFRNVTWSTSVFCLRNSNSFDSVKRITPMNSMNRRKFIKGTFLASASLGMSARSWAQVAGANDTLRVAVIGFNSRGGDHLSNIQSLAAKGEKVKLVALCDADEQVLRKGVERKLSPDALAEGKRRVEQILARQTPSGTNPAAGAPKKRP